MQASDANLRSETTLFLLASADGRITSGESLALDPDWDWKRVHGVKEGLGQYYRIEQTTDLYSLISGKVAAKLRAHKSASSQGQPKGAPFLNSIVIDRKPWLTREDIIQMARDLKHLYIVTTNANHPAHGLRDIGNLTVIPYEEEIDFSDLFRKMKQDHGANRITVQSGGTLNAVLIRRGLIDHLLIVVAPLLVGGRATPSIMDGDSLQTEADLSQLKALRLTRCEALQDSYVRLEYDVIQETVIDSK
jgi:2,5-diamino-6-(ribosylamino)-4(3H)-pyrimidinone 5'-phosphate reductase